MRILDRSVYVGPSLYARFPVIRLELDLEIRCGVALGLATARPLRDKGRRCQSQDGKRQKRRKCRRKGELGRRSHRVASLRQNVDAGWVVGG